MSSRLPGFYNLSIESRWRALAEQGWLSPEDISELQRGLELSRADKMIENVIGVYGLPLGVATNFLVNGRDVLVPMVVEEPSVVAGASKAALAARECGGFTAEADESLMVGQVQLLDVPDLERAAQSALQHQAEILALANAQDPVLSGLGGGARSLRVRALTETPVGPMLVVELECDVRDAMGANAVNTMVEAIAPLLATVTGGRPNLRIITNLADRRLARARVRLRPEVLAVQGLDGQTVARRIVEAYALAVVDPYRAATHNKGIMNGVDAVVIATGNDWRAVEAGAHAYAARSGRYGPLAHWQLVDGELHGELEMPLAVGTVGGATRVHPVARLALGLMGASSARALAEVIAAVGLAQNLAALWALVTEGIQRGHMELHARQVAVAAGATGDEIEAVARAMVASREVRLDAAQRLLQQMRKRRQGDASDEA